MRSPNPKMRYEIMMIGFRPITSLSWPRVVCVAVEASIKPVNSQLDDSRDMNSEAITACVAMTMLLSALARNTAVVCVSAVDTQSKTTLQVGGGGRPAEETKEKNEPRSIGVMIHSSVLELNAAAAGVSATEAADGGIASRAASSSSRYFEPSRLSSVLSVPISVCEDEHRVVVP